MRKKSWNDWYTYEKKDYSCPKPVIEERAKEFDSNVFKTLVQLEKHLRSYGWDKVRFEQGAITTGRQGEFSQPVTLKLQVRGGSKLTQVRTPIVMDTNHAIVIEMTALGSTFGGNTVIDVPAPFGEKDMKVEVDCPSSELRVFEIEKASFGWNTRKRWPLKNLKTFAGILTDVFLRSLGHSRRASSSMVSDRFLGFDKEGGDTFASFLDDLSDFADDGNCRGISSLFSVWRTKAPKWGFDRATINAMVDVMYVIKAACRR